MAAIGEFLRAWRDARRFCNERRRIVFYSEGRSYTKYFDAVIRALIENQGARLAYLTSDPADPILAVHDPRIDVFYVGMRSVRTFVFQMLKASVLITTMPDLETFHIKRSRVHPVHYVYLHHSIVSTHMIYRSKAFDHFDSILCVGPHHLEEIRAWEKLNGLPEKRLFEHGYAPLDSLMASARSLGRPPRLEDGMLNVLLAPTWGPNGILERGAEPLVDALLQAGHRVVVRPHPRTLQFSGRKLDALSAHFKDNPRFFLDKDTATLETLLHSHIMISDWSGVAMEYTFGLERPVLFIDVPRKVNNPRWSEIGIVPLEDFYRKEVGLILPHDRLADAPTIVEYLWESSAAFAERARALRDKYVFNPGSSGSCGAKIIAGLAKEAEAPMASYTRAKPI
jgi:hypothetical protein